MEELPFKAEYAKSGRAGCKACKSPINKDSLRMAVMVQSPFFDGKMPNWFHDDCFWKRGKPTAVTEIYGYDGLRWEDQEKISKRISGGGAASAGTGKGKKKGGAAAKEEDTLNDYTAEYAKSNKSKCRGCEDNIDKGEARLAVKDYSSQRAVMYGPQNLWYHVNCFSNKREDVGFTKEMNPAKMVGWSSLSKEDQNDIISLLGKGSKIKKRAATDEVDSGPSKKSKSDEIEQEKLKEQSALIWKFKDQLKSEVTANAMKGLLEYNGQSGVAGEAKLLDCVSDCMTFGALQPCPECKGQLKYRTDSYYCTGNISEWTKCEYSSRTPQRKAFKVPKEFHDVPFLKGYKYVKRDRIFPKATLVASNPAHLAGLSFYISGSLNKTQLKSQIDHLGGKTVTSIKSGIHGVFGTETEVTNGKKACVKDAQKHQIPVLSKDLLDALRDSTTSQDASDKVSKNTLSTWTCKEDLANIIKESAASVSRPTKSLAVRAAEKRNELSFLKEETVRKLKVKGGAAVDPDSGLEDVASLVQEYGEPLNAVLSMVDTRTGTNSYYKLQCLVRDTGSTYYVFRSWGRIGTTIGGDKIENFKSKNAAVQNFKEIFQDKTGNCWGAKEFKKVANKFQMLDLDYGNDEEKLAALNEKSGKTSKLAQPVQKLIQMIFDIEGMKKAMVEFELDMKKMPLGKISKKNITQAYKLLTKCQTLLEGKHTQSEVRDMSNQFFHIIPHDFGMKKPPLLDSAELIRAKIDMLDSLSEIECAYNLLKSADDDTVDPIDQHYTKLKCKLDHIKKEHDDYKMVEKYINNTHGSTHSHYKLTVEDVFQVARQGEKSRFSPFKELSNRKLLWHGSRLTNWAGILSQGLRIAPPEAPATGYMFGKGVYFADMVSKSANYCFANRDNPYGLLLLCDVALGEMDELLGSKYVTSLPAGKHSVKGCGSTEPDPKDFTVTKDGLHIPHGKGQAAKLAGRSSLLYNEYIVYDVAQLQMKYLIKVKFDYSY